MADPGPTIPLDPAPAHRPADQPGRAASRTPAPPLRGRLAASEGHPRAEGNSGEDLGAGPNPTELPGAMRGVRRVDTDDTLDATDHTTDHGAASSAGITGSADRAGATPRHSRRRRRGRGHCGLGGHRDPSRPGGHAHTPGQDHDASGPRPNGHPHTRRHPRDGRRASDGRSPTAGHDSPTVAHPFVSATDHARTSIVTAPLQNTVRAIVADPGGTVGAGPVTRAGQCRPVPVSPPLSVWTFTPSEPAPDSALPADSPDSRAAAVASTLWPGAVVERLVLEFTAPGQAVAFTCPAPPHTWPEPGGCAAHSAGSAAGLDVACAIAARLGRAPRALGTPPAHHTGGHEVAPAALVLACVPAASADWIDRHELAMPRAGGTLAVLTGTAYRGGRLVDPTWAIVCAARRGGARYVGHVIAVHTGAARLLAATTTATLAGLRERRDAGDPDHPDGPGPDTDHGPDHGAVGGAVGAHQRAHHDVLVFHVPPVTPDPPAEVLAGSGVALVGGAR